jgi:hypothetical protein
VWRNSTAAIPRPSGFSAVETSTSLSAGEMKIHCPLAPEAVMTSPRVELEIHQ